MAMPSKNNDTGARLKSQTRASFVRRAPDKAVFGDEAEIANRVGGTIGTLPDNAPSKFVQLGPDAGGARPDNFSPTKRAGNQKFGNGRRYV